MSRAVRWLTERGIRQFLDIGSGHSDSRQRPRDRPRELYRRTPTALYFSTPEQVQNLLAGWDLVDPGLVPVADRNPSPDLFQPATPGMLVAIGRKP